MKKLNKTKNSGNNKFVVGTLMAAMVLTGCNAASGSQGNDTKLAVKDKKEVTKTEFTSEYSPYRIEDGYLTFSEGSNSFSKLYLDLSGEISVDAIFSADQTGNILKNKNNTYFSVEGLYGSELYEKEDFLNGAENNLSTEDDRGVAYATGEGFFLYRYGESHKGDFYLDKDMNVIRELDGDYNMIWDDKYFIKGGRFFENKKYNYNDKYYYPFVFDANTSRYNAPNDFGEIYDLEENLLVHIDLDSIPCTNANYILVGEDLLLETPTSENLEYENKATIRLLDFDMNEVQKIAGAYDLFNVSQSEYLYINILEGKDAAKGREGTLAEGLEPGYYVYDVEKREFVKRNPIPVLVDISDDNGFYSFKDSNGESMYGDNISDYIYLGDGYYLIKNNGECALVDRFGTYLEEFGSDIQFDSKADDEGFYYKGQYVEYDDVMTTYSYPGMMGYLVFESKKDTDSLYNTVVYKIY